MGNNVFKLTDKQWEYFKNKKLFVKCKTEKDAKSFMCDCEKQGLIWEYNIKPTENSYWDTYYTATAYCCNRNKYLGYCFDSYYKNYHPDIPIVTYIAKEEVEEEKMAANMLTINFPSVYDEVPLRDLKSGELFMLPCRNDIVYMKTFLIVNANDINYNSIDLCHGCHHNINEDNCVIRVKGTLNLEYDNN